MQTPMKLLKNFLKDRAQEYTHKKLGLDRVRAALEVLDHPEHTYPSVLIAGTNGKGSVATMLEAVLCQAGYAVGCYTSPHVERFTERIRVGAQEVSEEELEEALDFFAEKKLLQADGQMQTPSEEALTWFEKTTLLALEIFRRHQVPLALLEVGLGARLDATNIVDPTVSVITSIGKDHMEVLGDSLFDIAKEKMAVARSGRPLILGEMDPNVRNFLNKGSRILGAHPVVTKEPQGTSQDFSYGPLSKLSLAMTGQHQLQNAATVIETIVALKEAGFKIENQHVRAGLVQAKLPGRVEKYPGPPEIWCDGAHNENALAALITEVRAALFQKFKRPLTIVFASMREKDIKTLLKQLAVLKPHFIFTQVDSPRAIPAAELAHLANFLPEKLEHQVIENPQTALQTACKQTPPDGLIIVTGSLYLVGEVRASLER